jgi:hypothetical protein
MAGDESHFFDDLCRYWLEARRELEDLRDLKVQEGPVDFGVRERVLVHELTDLERTIRGLTE